MKPAIKKVVLDEHQVRAEMEAVNAISSGYKKLLLVGPPGSGKGMLIAYFASGAAKKKNKTLIWVHKRELCIDLKQRIKGFFGIESGLILSGFKPEQSRTIQIASVQTAIRRKLGRFSFLLTDEAHRALSPSQRKLLALNKDAVLMSFTATPVRGDRKSFEDVYDKLIQVATYRELMDKRLLMPTEVIAPKGVAAYEGVKIRGNEYAQGELEKEYTKQRLYKGLYEQWKKWMDGESTMIFNTGKKHNREVCEYFQSMGESCAYVDDSTSRDERKRIVTDFKEGRLTIICNIYLFGEGVDAAICSSIVLNYATQRLSRYIQNVARGSRPMWNEDRTDWKKENGEYVKTKVKVLDMGGNTVRHGILEDYDSMGFDLSGKRKKMPAPTKVCDNCRTVVYASAKICEHCGYEFEFKPNRDEKKYSDEVEFGKLKREKVLAGKIADMRHDRIKKAPAGWLRIIALTKGYHLTGWPYQVLKARGEYNAFDSKNVMGWVKLREFLTREEKKAGMHDTYLNMKELYNK